MDIASHPTKSSGNLPNELNKPKWLQTLKFLLYPIEFLQESNSIYDGIFTMRTYIGPPTVVLSHPQAIQEVFTANADLFDTNTEEALFTPITGENAINAFEGDAYKRVRRMMAPAFFDPKHIKGYGLWMCELTKKEISKWSIGKPFSIYPTLEEIGVRALIGAIFGMDDEERLEEIITPQKSIMDFFQFPLTNLYLLFPFLRNELGAWSGWGKVLRQKQLIDKFLTAEIQKRQAQSNCPNQDILSLLLCARDETGQPLKDEVVRDSINIIIFASQAVAIALAWALYWIYSHSEVRDKLKAELASLGSDADKSAIATLPYLNAVCSETLRISPINLFIISRKLKAPFEVMGCQLPVGTMLYPCVYLSHHREDIYPDPHLFKPERFLDRRFSRYEYYPFGGGSRGCLGPAFALIEMKLVLATILSQVEFELIDRRNSSMLRNDFLVFPVFIPAAKMVVKSRQC